MFVSGGMDNTVKVWALDGAHIQAGIADSYARPHAGNGRAFKTLYEQVIMQRGYTRIELQPALRDQLTAADCLAGTMLTKGVGVCTTVMCTPNPSGVVVSCSFPSFPQQKCTTITLTAFDGWAR
jgi:hypothetical protein